MYIFESFPHKIVYAVIAVSIYQKLCLHLRDFGVDNCYSSRIQVDSDEAVSYAVFVQMLKRLNLPFLILLLS